ncbi:MAG: hypothetical protein AAB212_04725 [Bacteroidota bacterium]
MNIYAYCLMPNHFHLLISIKEEKQLYDILSKSISFKNISVLAPYKLDIFFKRI